MIEYANSLGAQAKLFSLAIDLEETLAHCPGHLGDQRCKLNGGLLDFAGVCVCVCVPRDALLILGMAAFPQEFIDHVLFIGVDEVNDGFLAMKVAIDDAIAVIESILGDN